MRCILYARVSLEEQAEQFGLASQLRALREYAKAKGYTVAEEFVDDYSGGDMDRPAISRIRAIVRARSIDVVIVHDPDRLSRKLLDMELFRDECERAEVLLEFVTTPPALTAESTMFLQMKGVFAQFERRKIAERTLRGRREKARQGFIVGGRVPFGFKYLGKADGERGKLIVDPERAPVVRQIFEWAAGGTSIRSIAARLNEAGTPSMLAERWGKSSILRILQNQTYIGTAHYNRRKRCEPRELTVAQKARHNKKTLLKERPASEWISIATPAIVSPDVFEQVAAMLQRNKDVLCGRESRRYLLRGLLWCQCGVRMSGDPNHGSPCYRCLGRDKSAGKFNGCRRRANGQKLDTAVWEAIAPYFKSEKQLRALIDRHQERFQKPEVDATEIQRRIEALKLKESRGVRALMDLDGEHQGLIRAELRKLADERRRLQAQLDSVGKESLHGDAIGRIVKQFVAAFVEMDAEQRQEFLRRIVERVTLKGIEVAIVCCLPAQNWAQRADDVVSIEQSVSFTIETRLAA